MLRERLGLFVGVGVIVLVPIHLILWWLAPAGSGGVADLFPSVGGPASVSAWSDSDALRSLSALFVQAIPAGVGGLVGGRVLAQRLAGGSTRLGVVGPQVLRRLPALLVSLVVTRFAIAAGLLALGVGSLVAVVLCQLTSPVLAVEGGGAWTSVRRGAGLVKDRFWAGVVTVGAMVGISLILSLVFWGSIELLGQGFGLPATTLDLVRLGSRMARAAVEVPLVGCLSVVFYVDCRCRLEGWDLSLDNQGAVSS